VAQPKVPQYIVEQVGEEWDTYLALARLAAAPPARPITTGKSRTLMKCHLALLGMDPAEFAAHSARIGGASDIADAAIA
jgi:hypothetical protein